MDKETDEYFVYFCIKNDLDEFSSSHIVLFAFDLTTATDTERYCINVFQFTFTYWLFLPPCNAGEGDFGRSWTGRHV